MADRGGNRNFLPMKRLRPRPSKAAREFEPRGEKPHETQRRRTIQRRFIETARQASLDLGDDMGV